MKINRICTRKVLSLGLACIALFAGCAGFTEDVNGTAAADAGNIEGIDVEQMAARFAQARFLQAGSLTVGEAHDSVTLTFEINGGCVKEGESFAYDRNFYYANSQTYAYSFRGDTLLLSRIYEPDPYEADQERYKESFIFVGGIPGSLDGIWKNTQCRYREEMIYCMNDGYDQYFKFDDDKVEVRVMDREDYDYMQSVLVGQLFDFLGRGSSIQLETPFYYSEFYADTKDEQEEYGIDIIEKTNKSMKFTYADLTFDLNIDYAYYKDSLSVSLKSGDVTCVGKHREINFVPPEMCSADYGDNLYETETSGLVAFEEDNDLEFEACIDGILGRSRE